MLYRKKKLTVQLHFLYDRFRTDFNHYYSRLISAHEIIHFSLLPLNAIVFHSIHLQGSSPSSAACHPLSTLFPRLLRAHRFLVGSLQSDFSFRGQFFGVMKRKKERERERERETLPVFTWVRTDFFLRELAEIRRCEFLDIRLWPLP